MSNADQQKKKQSKAMINNKQGSLALPEDLQGDWGTEETDSSDIIIPKLLLMHGQSEIVQDGGANIGDLVKSTSKKVVAKKGETVKVIPFMFYKTWVNEVKVDGKWKWTGEEPLTPANADLPWEYQNEEGEDCRRSAALNFYAMLVDDIGTEVSLPTRLQFKRTSKKAGTPIAHFFAECRMQKKPGAVKTWEIGSETIKGDETYQIFTSKMGEDTPLEQMMVCKQWYMEISKNRAKFKDHNDDEQETVATPPPVQDKHGNATQEASF